MVTIFRICLIFIMSGFIYEVDAGNILVSLFDKYPLSTLAVSSTAGNIYVQVENEEDEYLDIDGMVYVSKIDNHLLLVTEEGVQGIFRRLSFWTGNKESLLKIKPVLTGLDGCYYEGIAHMHIDYERIMVINEVPEEIYLTAVVEAEAGNNAHAMFYQVQAVISRTYLYSNPTRHPDEGFHLCDDVHCQVYKGSLTGNQKIRDAVVSTSDLVLMTNDSVLINPVFHSNCGGETMNSEDVWLIPLPYLRSVNDPYCNSGINYSWVRTLQFEDWESYLVRNGLSMRLNISTNSDFNFDQSFRKNSYRIGEFSLPLVKIRSDWGLRSAFFSVRFDDSTGYINLNGRGYGHGVGLCQEGAMEMASRGYNFINILQFYYNSVIVGNKGDL